MSTGRDDSLLHALRCLRGEPVSMPLAKAHAIVVTTVQEIARKVAPDSSELALYAAEAIAYAQDICCLGGLSQQFRGTTAAEARSFLRVVIVNKLRDCWRADRRRRAVSFEELENEGRDLPDPGDVDTRLDAASRLRLLRWLRVKILLRAPEGRRDAIRTYLAYRLDDPGAAAPKARSDETRRERDAIYQRRHRGREYLRELLPVLETDLRDDEEWQLLAALVSDAGPSSRPSGETDEP